ncbi:response regulator [Paraburkholderia sp. SIMBA_054]|uniref:response regulator n=1 Tax=Paraburkholderia sp. SIMBA_054 TaxID=3085795 RepID=UPI00397C4D9D
METSERRPTVLLAEDHDADAWATVLRMNGWEVVWAPNGDAALALHGSRALICLLLPGTDGPALCRVFREDANLASVPIILASSLEWSPAATVVHDHFLQKQWKVLRCLPLSRLF